MSQWSARSFIAGAVLASSLTVGGLVLADSDSDGEGNGMMGGGMMGMMSMMSQMQEMMGKCNAMMDHMHNQQDGQEMMAPEGDKPEASS